MKGKGKLLIETVFQKSGLEQVIVAVTL